MSHEASQTTSKSVNHNKNQNLRITGQGEEQRNHEWLGKIFGFLLFRGWTLLFRMCQAINPYTSYINRVENSSLPSFAYFVVMQLWNVQFYNVRSIEWISRVDYIVQLPLKFEIIVLLFHYLSLLCSSMAAKYTYFMWVYSVQSHWNMDFNSETLFNVDMNKFVDSPGRYCPILHRL